MGAWGSLKTMSNDRLILAVIGLVLMFGGAYLLVEAKKYARARKSRSETLPDKQAAQPPVTGERGITPITPVGGNILLDLGFSPEEAERLKAKSDHRIDQEKTERRHDVCDPKD